jgi:hypothetical protein
MDGLRAPWPTMGELAEEGREGDGERRGEERGREGGAPGGLLGEHGPLLVRGCSSVRRVLLVTTA